MNQLLNNSKPTKQRPVSGKWIVENGINPKTSTILNFEGTGNDTIIKDNMPVLIDTSKTKPRTTASELFLIKRDEQTYFSYLSTDEHGCLIVRGLESDLKSHGLVEISEMIFPQNIKSELEITGKAFPLINIDIQTAH